MSDLALQRSILQTGSSLDWVGRPTKPTIEEMLLVRLKLPRAWTAEEDARLARLARENGLRNWHRVSRQMPGRSHALCRDRWSDHLARDVYHRAFTAADDAELARLHQRHGGRWRYISRRRLRAHLARHEAPLEGAPEERHQEDDLPSASAAR
ncbi:hypothetical protein ZWY2020_043400 [Hordeum vulgare]|nr:hypothetical protein ZWY2020_043400 [Hordeum vulgare]